MEVTMQAQLSDSLDFHSKALVLRAERQRLIASNIANADTPGYSAREVDFKATLAEMTGSNRASLKPLVPASTSKASSPDTNPKHLPLKPLQSQEAELGAGIPLIYAANPQASMDSNTVDLDRERASFADNAVRYEATLRFINGNSKTLLSAITGQ
jgi:flagellar basal-body rod protein FlgB